jgi:hypothetical protein
MLQVKNRTLREEHRWKVFENKVLKRILGPKTDNVTGNWRKLHNEQLRGITHSAVLQFRYY